jgi:predicted ATPase
MPDGASLIHADIGSEGQYAPWWYAEHSDDEIEEGRRHPKESASTLRRQLDAYLDDLFPGASANADPIDRTSLVRIGFRTGRTSDWVRPANVGYGVIYAFPLLVAVLLAHKNQTIVIDSPEAHLHPKAQSRLGQTLARMASAGVQVLVESHSDHVLNGVRLAVRGRLISENDVKVHFFRGVREDGAHGVVTPALDSEGNIDAWPDGFFDQSELDLAVLAGWD